MPQSHVFHRCHRIPTNHSRKAAQLLARNRIPLVWHRRRPLLTRTKILLHLKHFRALQMTKLRRPSVNTRRNQRQRHLVLRMPISLHHLRAQGRRLQPKTVTHHLLHLRIKMRMCPHRSTQLAHTNPLLNPLQPRQRTPKLVVHQRQLQPKRHRLRVNPMTTPNHRRHLELHRTTPAHLNQLTQIFQQKVRSLSHLHRERRIQHVR